MRTMTLRAALMTALALAAGQLNAAQVTINPATTYQTIDGLGGFGGMQPWWNSPPYYNQLFLNVLIDSLGLTILRTELYPKGPACGSGSGENQVSMWTRQAPYLKALRQKAEASGEPLKFMGSVWSPPGGWKSDGSCVGGYLLPAHHNDYAQYLMDYASEFQDSVGAALYVISPQNEPGFCFGYNSSCQLPADFSPQVIAIANYWATHQFTIPLSYADIVWWPDWLGQCVSWVCQNRVADSVCSILSIHYSGGPDDIAGTREGDSLCGQMAAGYTDYRTVNRGKKSRLWNTEFGGQFSSWNESQVDEGGNTPGAAWTFARNLYLCLYFNFNAVVYWQLCEPPHSNANGDHYSLFYSNPSAGTLQLGPLFRVAQQFYRFIRPGMVRVGASSNDAEVWTVAFTNASSGAFTVVALNTGAAQKTLTLAGTGLPSTLNVRQTSPSQNFADLGTVASNGSVTLPSRSVTTLYALGTTPVIPQPRATAAPAAPVTRGPVAVCELDGKRVNVRPAVRGLTPGVYCVSGDGRVSARMQVADQR